MRSRSILVLLIALALPVVAHADSKKAEARGVCGGVGGVHCNEGLWCDPKPGNCGVTDAEGVCVETGDACTYEYRPVCGCDKKNYSNDCVRQHAHVAKDHDGECREP